MNFRHTCVLLEATEVYNRFGFEKVLLKLPVPYLKVRTACRLTLKTLRYLLVMFHQDIQSTFAPLQFSFYSKMHKFRIVRKRPNEW